MKTRHKSKYLGISYISMNYKANRLTCLLPNRCCYLQATGTRFFFITYNDYTVGPIYTRWLKNIFKKNQPYSTVHYELCE